MMCAVFYVANYAFDVLAAAFFVIYKLFVHFITFLGSRISGSRNNAEFTAYLRGTALFFPFFRNLFVMYALSVRRISYVIIYNS